MINLILTEWMKLKRSKLLPVFCVVLLVAVPLLAAIGVVSTPTTGRHHADVLLQKSLAYNCNYSCILLAPVIAVFAIMIFSREYTDGTIKTISSIPVGNAKLLFSKLITVFLWAMALSVFAWLCTCLSSVAYDPHYELSMAVENTVCVFTYLCKFLLSGFLCFLIIAPIVFITVFTRGYILPMLATVLLTTLSFLLASRAPADLFYFWTCSRYLLDDQAHFAVLRALSIRLSGVYWISSLLIVLPAVASYVLSYLRMKYKDVA